MINAPNILTSTAIICAMAAPLPAFAESDSESWAFNRASELIGKNVINRAGESLGEIDNLAIELDSGRAPFAVLSFGGVMGVGDKLFAIPWDALSFDREKNAVLIDISKERLKEAPGFDAKQWPDLADEQWTTSVNKFYGLENVDRDWQNLRGSGGWSADTEYGRLYDAKRTETITGTITAIEQVRPMPQMAPGTCVTIDAQGTTHIVHLAPSWFIDNQSPALDRGDQVVIKGSPANVDGKPVIMASEIRRGDELLVLRDAKSGRPLWVGWASRSHDDSSSASESTRTSGRIVKASDIIDMNVVNPKDEDLGEIEDIVINLNQGKVTYAVLSFGGLLGVNEKFFALPWQTLKLNRAQQAMMLNIDKERMKSAPGFDKNNWPNMADDRWARESSEYYGVPYEDRSGKAAAGDTRSRGWGKSDEYARAFDAKSIDTIRGTVISVDHVTPMDGMSEGVLIKLNTENTTMAVHLGPAWYIDRQDLNINVGDPVKVTGSRVNLASGPAIIATEIEAHNNTLKLREKDGSPHWSAWRSSPTSDRDKPAGKPRNQ